jgi:hypothetical protein
MERMNVSFKFTEIGNKRYICIYLDRNVPMYIGKMWKAKARVWYQICSSPLVSEMPFELEDLLFTSHNSYQRLSGGGFLFSLIQTGFPLMNLYLFRYQAE